jgi:hypothetical protein
MPSPDALTLPGEICTYLQNVGTTTTPLIYSSGGERNLYVGSMPDAGTTANPVPDLCVAVIQRPGLTPLGVLQGQTGNATALKFARPAVQILTRAGQAQYQAGDQLAESIFGTLHGLSDIVLNSGGALFHRLWALSSPAYLGQTGGRERHLWSLNMETWWEDPALG